jgi:leader peptidase (prepilin peptidase)/N-methyltransferase
MFAWMIVGLVGACAGSFLNVCIHRLPLHRSIVTPRSACPGCGSLIAWYDNVPILSYILLRGRCRRCRAPISPQYPAVEAATAALFLLLFAARGPSIAFLLDAVFAAALLALMVIDARHQILPNAITLPGVAAGLLTSPLRGGPPWSGVQDACLGALLGFGILWGVNEAYLLWQAAWRVPKAERQDGIGQGDFKLLAMIGAFQGVRMVLFTLFVGALAGAVFGLVMMRTRGYGWKSKLPYGVFLGGAAILALFVGEPSVRLYMRFAGIGP